MAGSGIFESAKPRRGHLVRPGSADLGGEVADLREDVRDALAPMLALTVEEFTNPLAGSTTALMAATASQTTPRTLTPGAAAQGTLTQASVDNLVGAPRRISFTTAGSTAANQPATATVTGTDERGQDQVEVVNLSQTSGTVLTNNFFRSVSKIELAAGEGTGATLAIGLGDQLGLSRTPRVRAGMALVLQEIVAGALAATAGTVTPGGAGQGKYGAYVPDSGTGPDGARDFAVVYEYVP